MNVHTGTPVPVQISIIRRRTILMNTQGRITSTIPTILVI